MGTCFLMLFTANFDLDVTFTLMCDLDLNPMTLILKFDLVMVKIYPCTQFEAFM